MDNNEFIKSILRRIKKFSWAIILFALVFGGLFYFMAKNSLVRYSSMATVFPLNGNTDNSLSISNVLGLSSESKSFSSEASINIVELATSRRTREAVAGLKVKEFDNKTFAELLIEENNRHTGILKNTFIDIPKDSMPIINIGVSILKEGLSATISKSGVLELGFKNTNEKLVRLISYAFIDKISEFYILLKKEKAQVDYNFAAQKVDSLSASLKQIDERLVRLNESTFFANEALQRYSLPKINLAQEKQLVQQQYILAVNNRENAAYKLQKETPIIKVLDNPEPPYSEERKSTLVYIVIGLFIGTILGFILISWKIISRYIQTSLNNSIGL